MIHSETLASSAIFTTCNAKEQQTEMVKQP